jgi:hypothetical protein
VAATGLTTLWETYSLGQPKTAVVHGPYLYFTHWPILLGGEGYKLAAVDLAGLGSAGAPRTIVGEVDVTGAVDDEALCNASVAQVAAQCTSTTRKITHPRRIAGDGSYLYEANQDGGLVVWRLARPVGLAQTGRVGLSPSGVPGGMGAEVYGSKLITARNGSVSAYDLRDPSAPALFSSVSVGDATRFADVKVVQDTIFVSKRLGTNLQVTAVEINADGTLSAGSSWSNFDVTRSMAGLVVRWPYAYALDSTSTTYTQSPRLRIVDLRTMTSPNTALSLALSSATPWYSSLVYHRGYLFVSAAGDTELAIVDVRTPATPTVSSLYDPAALGALGGLSLNGNRLFVASLTGGMEVLDVTIPTSPVSLASYASSNLGAAIDTSGDYLFVASEITRGKVVSVADIATPYIADTVGLLGEELGVAGVGKHMLMLDLDELVVIQVE